MRYVLPSGLNHFADQVVIGNVENFHIDKVAILKRIAAGKTHRAVNLRRIHPGAARVTVGISVIILYDGPVDLPNARAVIRFYYTILIL